MLRKKEQKKKTHEKMTHEDTGHTNKQCREQTKYILSQMMMMMMAMMWIKRICPDY